MRSNFVKVAKLTINGLYGFTIQDDRSHAIEHCYFASQYFTTRRAFVDFYRHTQTGVGSVV